MSNEDVLRDQAEKLRRSYRQSRRPANGLNGGRTQTLTRPEQFDELLNGLGQIVDAAVSELERRQQREPGTLIGMGEAGPDQVVRMRMLNRIPVNGGGNGGGQGRSQRISPGVGLGRRHINSGRRKPGGGMKR